MATQEPPQDFSLRERTRLALLDNQHARAQDQGRLEAARPVPPEAQQPPNRADADRLSPVSQHEQAGAQSEAGREISCAELVERRLQALHEVRELSPRRHACGEWLQELEENLREIPHHSVHYRPTVERLLEAQEEWMALEERLRSAHEVIRSTQWLVALLAGPARGLAEGRPPAVADQGQPC